LLKEKLNIELGGRLNRHPIYGSHTTYTFNPTYQINRGWRFFGTVATGYKAPSIFQVYDQYSGNNQLKPERAINYEIGIQQETKKLTARLLYFSREIKDGIDYNYTNFTYFNFVKQSVQGVEAAFLYRPFAHIQVAINYTYLDGKEYTQSRKSFADTIYRQLLRRPKNNFNIQLNYQFSKQFSTSIQGKYVSGRNDVGGYKQEDVWLSDYFLMGVNATYKLNNHIGCTVEIQNLFNKRFFEIRGYNAIPFLINGGISFRW
jgi:vitamin B12 transporter